MSENKHTMQDLYEMQALPLNLKVALTKDRIRGWVNEFGEDGVYVSFSGGKDSTVLLHIVREMYPNIPAVFVDVPTQYPELKEFAQTFDNVEVLKPRIGFAQVCEKYGFPLFSKELAQKIEEARHCPNGYASKSFIPPQEGGRHERYNMQRYKFALDAEFGISAKCCNEMKKNPAKKYEKQTQRKPIVATMASESAVRAKEWIVNGCNAWNKKRAISAPMSFWTEQDVLTYIKMNNIPICSVYGEVVEDWDATEDVEGQLTMSECDGWGDLGMFDAKRPPLKTTGCDRTGCVLCGFGCHIEKGEGRFERLKQTHPKFYALLDVIKNNGVTYREAIEWVNEHGNMNIRL